jgi:hypothetical protein
VSRKKDRERFIAMKQLNQDYMGFRGNSPPEVVSNREGLQTVTCSECGRKRNVPTNVATEHSKDYVCATCQEESEGEASKEPTAGGDETTLENREGGRP